jgi:hypothetical protein
MAAFGKHLLAALIETGLLTRVRDPRGYETFQ